MMEKYILDKNNNAVLEPNVIKWGQWFETANRRVNSTVIEKSSVSTVFLGLDHAFGDGLFLFETMVFGGKLDQEMNRCTTWKEAEKMHEAMCKRVINSL